MKNARFFLEYIVLVLLGKIIRLLPRRALLLLGAWAGTFVYYCVPVRKKITLDHLRSAFPEKSEKNIRDIARKSYQNLVMISVEHLCFPGLTKDKLLNTVRIENFDKLEKAYGGKKGVLFVGGHFGSWEYMGSAASAKGYDVSYVVADIGNPHIDEMVNTHRKKFGVDIITKSMSIRHMMKTLKRNGGIAMLMDQDAGRSGTFVEYFGKICSTPTGPALLALRTGAAIVFIAAIRQKDGTVRGFIEDIDVDYETGPTEENIHRLTQSCTRMLESYVRKHPDQWFWMHRRWKTTPEMLGLKE